MFVWLGMTLMKLIIVLVLLLALQGSASASEGLIEAASVVGDTLYLCVSREGRSTGRSYLGEQPLSELRAWSLESHQISLSTGRSLSRWKVDVKKELRLENSVQKGIAGMAGENLYFKYSSALYKGPMRGRTNQHGGVVLFNRHGLRRLGAFPTNVNWYREYLPLPGVDGSLKLIFEAGAVLFTTNGVQLVSSPLMESPALAEDWKREVTGSFSGLRIGTFGRGGEFLWHLRFPPGRSSYNWDEPLEIVQQAREQVRVQQIRHWGAAVLWDGEASTMVLSQGKKSDWHLGIDRPNGERTDLGRCSGVFVADPTARTVVIIQDSADERVVRWLVDRRYERCLKLRVLRITEGKLADREVNVVLD